MLRNLGKIIKYGLVHKMDCIHMKMEKSLKKKK